MVPLSCPMTSYAPVMALADTRAAAHDDAINLI